MQQASSQLDSFLPSKYLNPENPSKKAKFNDVPYNYKTIICRHWKKHGSCRMGKECAFAHGEKELRPPSNITEKSHGKCQESLISSMRSDRNYDKKANQDNSTILLMEERVKNIKKSLELERERMSSLSKKKNNEIDLLSKENSSLKRKNDSLETLNEILRKQNEMLGSKLDGIINQRSKLRKRK
tara:strand:+ start:1522 stop:2076 length:555 start_codon:yes stop_codon:yes gene_type:complete